MEFDDTYLNRSANKWPRPTPVRPQFVVWHETASPNPDNPHGTLSYNLSARVQSSYNYLIARDGTIFHYIDERSWVAYHAGLHSAARGYVDWGVNVNSIGVEVDGRNDGTPITAEQRDAIIALIVYFKNIYGIPIDREYHLAHKEVAPGYKSDPRCFSVSLAVQLAQQAARPQPPQPQPPQQPSAPPLGDQLRQVMYAAAGTQFHADWAFHQFAKTNKLGAPIKLGLDFLVGGQRYQGEIYGRDAIFSPYGQWNVVLRLSQIQNAQLFDALIRRVYTALNLIYNPSTAFYSFARQNAVGVPLAESVRLRIPSGSAYATQLYTMDLLYTPIGVPESATNWADVRRMSPILTGTSITPAQRELATTAYQVAYARLGGRFDASDPLWQASVKRGAGMPLFAPRQASVNGQTYNYTIFGGDMLAARVDTPGMVIAVSDLP